MSASCVRLVPGASRGACRNSSLTEDTRRHLQCALPYGAEERISARLGASVGHGSVHEQIEGRNRLSLDVLMEGLREVHCEAREALLDALLSPLGLAVHAVPRGGDPEAVAAANGAVLGAVGQLETVLGQALSDGVLSDGERRDIYRATRDAAHRLAALEALLRDGAA